VTARGTIPIDSLRIIVDELGQDGKGWILFTVAAGWFLSIGVRFMYPSLLPFFRAEFGFGLTIAGLLMSVLWFAYAIGQFPGGIIGDRIGGGNILVISTAVSTAAVFIVATSLNVWMLFGGTFIFGLATALYGPTRFTIFTNIYEKRAGTAVGLSHAAGSIGNTILPPMAAGIATYATWRIGYGILLPAFVGITIALRIWVPNYTSSTRQTIDNIIIFSRRIFSGIRQNGIPIMVAAQIILIFVSQGVLGFYPTYLIEIKGYSPTDASLLFGFYFAIGILIQPLTGFLNDRIGSEVTLAILVGLYFLGLLALHFARTLLHILFLTVLLSSRNGTGVVTNTFIADTLADDIKGSGLGLLRTVWMVTGATSPLFVGYLGDLGLLREAFLLLATLAGVATVLTALLFYRS